MSGNFFEDELRRCLRSQIETGKIRELGDSTIFFSRLMNDFPVIGSKIDWSHLPKCVEKYEDDQSLQPESFSKFFSDAIEKFKLSGDVIYAGDGAIDFAIGFDLNSIREVLFTLLDIPHHHYFIASDFSWCVCLTMEGDMGFGFNPRLICTDNQNA